MKTIKCTLTNIDINVKEARLLTKEEAEALPERLRLYNSWWWTSTANADNQYSAWRVDGYFGSLYHGGLNAKLTIRPALVFESNDLQIEDKFSFANKEFEVIKEGLALCITDIGESAFIEDFYADDPNDYEKSDIKKHIDKWLKENVK